MTTQRDYSLLRPFDTEAAKAGEKLTSTFSQFNGGPIWEYQAGPDARGLLCVKKTSDGEFATLSSADCFRMAPLCWVEDKPVYKGDTLYRQHRVGPRIVVGFDEEYLRLAESPRHPWALYRPESCTWTPPKAKREGWINIYPTDRALGNKVFGPFPTKEAALKDAADDLSACVFIEWEEAVQP